MEEVVPPGVSGEAPVHTLRMLSNPPRGTFMTVARKRKNQSRSVRRYKKEALLNEGIAGADSTSPVTQKLIDSAIDVLASAPKFWGRYFKGAGNTNPAQYQAGRENPVLERAKVRVLPIARQTNNVGGSGRDGDREGRQNAQAIVEAFGHQYLGSLNNNPLVFLDVEQTVPLSAEYYLGWSQALTDEGRKLSNDAVSLTPALYASYGSKQTWRALSASIGRGAICGGVWVARYVVSDGCAPMPVWSEERVRPLGLPEEVPVLAWQYAQNCKDIDCNQANPRFQDQLMDQLILPPETRVAVPELVARGQGDIDATIREMPSHVRDVLAALIEQLLEGARAREIGRGKPFLFPNGVHRIDLTIEISDAGNPSIKVSVSDGSHTKTASP
jgi:hypothetical protein